MTRYVRRPVTETVEAWKTDGVEPKPDWVPAWATTDMWLGKWVVKDDDGCLAYEDDYFREQFQLADPIPDDDYKFYSGFEILDAVNE